jgi:hypothetical protein
MCYGQLTLSGFTEMVMSARDCLRIVVNFSVVRLNKPQLRQASIIRPITTSHEYYVLKYAAYHDSGEPAATDDGTDAARVVAATAACGAVFLERLAVVGATAASSASDAVRVCAFALRGGMGYEATVKCMNLCSGILIQRLAASADSWSITQSTSHNPQTNQQ